jgi:hypothetical protein
MTHEKRETARELSDSQFSLGLVGELSYQRTIAPCSLGDDVLTWLEPNNPHHERALAVTTSAGKTIGYVPRGSVLHHLVLDQQNGCHATISRLRERLDGQTAVVLEVQLSPADQSPLPVRNFGAC